MEDPLPSDSRISLFKWIESSRLQFAAVVLATMLSSALHWENDGLWFQGDSPRHAASGLFYWDLLTSLPTDPIAYALSYYARYPIIMPVAYPPLFYLIEGVAFQVFGPSPFVGKTIVLMFCGMAGVYTALWGRRWIGPLAGWSGMFVVLLPGFIRNSNAVFLNVPATALGIAALYHFMRWLDTDRNSQRTLFTSFALATAFTYYPALIILPVSLVWLLQSRRRTRVLLLVAAVGLVLVTVATSLVPRYFQRNAPSLSRLFEGDRWYDFFSGVSALTGTWWPLLGLLGLAVAFWRGASGRQSVVRIGLAYVCVVICLVLLPFNDYRYGLLLAPLTVLAAFHGFVTVVDITRRWQSSVALVLLTLLLLASVQLARRVYVPRIAGVDQAAAFIRAHAAGESVLYYGILDGVFGFYLRAQDPDFQTRLVPWRKILYEDDAAITAMTPEDVVSTIREKSGSHWVVVESAGPRILGQFDLQLRTAIKAPDFELVRSIPLRSRQADQLDIYRVRPPVTPVHAIDLRFPAFSSQVFRNIQPIPSRR